MGEWRKITASDGHVLDAYSSGPAGKAAGAVVIVQEIFGVNGHIQSVVDRYADDGFRVVAPALFDRQRSGVQLAYEGEDAQTAFRLREGLKPETALLDVQAAFASIKQGDEGVAVVGFCYGGLISWLSATRGPAMGMKPACCVGYYAGGIGKAAVEEPSCPVMLHFGGSDSHIGLDQVEAVRRAHAEVEIYMYDGAQHGFNCDARASYKADAAALARERTMAFLKAHLAQGVEGLAGMGR